MTTTIIETPTLVIESFRKPIETPRVLTDNDAVTALRETYQRAGLYTLASTVDTNAATVQRLDTAHLLFTELSEGDTAAWKGFLPTSYEPNRYRYDFPSSEVAGLIADAKALKVFDRIEIWTPEGSSVMPRVKDYWKREGRAIRNTLDAAVDPMAVGIIEHNGRAHYFPVVRWGESLMSFRRIKALVAMRNAMVFSMTTLSKILAIAMVIGLVVGGFVATCVAIGVWGAIGAWVVGGFVIASIINYYFL